MEREQQFDIQHTGYSIRLAAPSDVKALRMLLPGIAPAAVNFVAVDGRHQLVIGAAVALGQFRRNPLPGPGIGVHVIEPCRRHGIGRALIGQLITSATTAGASALYAAKRVELDGEEMRAWQRLGFDVCETVERHLLSLVELEQQLTPLLDRMRARGRIPAGAQIIPLYRADFQEVLRLHLDNLGGDRADLLRRLKGQGAHAFLPQESLVLVVDGRTAGCALAHRISADTIVVDAIVVDAKLRGSWANAWLKLEGARGGIRAGATKIEFTTFDRYTDTRRFTRKLGGVTTGTSALMFRRIDRTPNP